MARQTFDGIDVSFAATESAAAEIIGGACAESSELIHDLWGLETPQDLRVYVVTSQQHAVFDPAPWPWRLALLLTLPVWNKRTQAMWRQAGGWAQSYGARRTVVVKPPWLIERDASQGSSALGDRVFVRDTDASIRTQRVACHEIVHAFAAHLGLPAWLNEGIAMVTVDRFAATPTVQPATIDALSSSLPGAHQQPSNRLDLRNPEAVVYLYVRGYWITRYLEATQPGLLKSLLAQRHSHGELETRLAAAFGMDRDQFWQQIDGMARREKGLDEYAKPLDKIDSLM